MRKGRSEKLIAVVAVSYLVIIPAGAIFVWQRVQAMQRDVDEMWNTICMPPKEEGLILGSVKKLRDSVWR